MLEEAVLKSNAAAETLTPASSNDESVLESSTTIVLQVELDAAKIKISGLQRNLDEALTVSFCPHLGPLNPTSALGPSIFLGGGGGIVHVDF